MWNYVESLTQGKHQSSETALLFRTETLETISLAGAAVLATHAGVGFGFFGGIVL